MFDGAAETQEVLPSPPLSPEIHWFSENTLQDSQNWLREHPDALHPFIKVVKDGKTGFIDEKGEKVKRDVERERQQVKKYLKDLAEKDPQYYLKLKSLEKESEPMKSQVRVVINNIGGNAEPPIDSDIYETNHSSDSKIAADLALLRSLNRDFQDGPLYILINSGRGLTDEELSGLLSRFDTNPYIEATTDGSGFTAEGYALSGGFDSFDWRVKLAMLRGCGNLPNPDVID